jgi:hypothetical protein
MIPAMVAVMELGKEEGATRVQEVGWAAESGSARGYGGESRSWAGSSSVYDE